MNINLNEIDIKDIGLRFGHWIALGASIVFILATIFMSSNAKLEKEQKKVIKLIKKLRRAQASNTLPLKELPNYFEIVKNRWRKIEKIEKAPTGEFIYESAKINYIHEVPPTHQWINIPRKLKVKVDREKITISWLPPVPPVDENGKKKEMTKINGYHLLKRWKDDKGNKHSKIYDLKRTRFVDRKVESKINYFYKVRAYTYNIDAKGGKKIKYKNKEIVVSKYTKEKKGMILPVYRIKLLGVAGDTAIIKLYRWVKGGWKSAICHIRKGEEIKTKERGIEFRPGWILKYINPKFPKKRKEPVKRLILKNGKPIKDDMGRLKYEIKMVERTYYVPAIGYIDEKGKRYLAFRETEKPKKSKK